MSHKDAGDWFSYQADRTRPRSSHERPMPSHDKVKKMGLNDRVTEVERRSDEPMVVEESDASDSMILKIVRKFRGE